MSTANKYQSVGTDESGDERYQSSFLATSDVTLESHYLRKISILITLTCMIGLAVAASFAFLRTGPISVQKLNQASILSLSPEFTLGSSMFLPNGTLPDKFTCKLGINNISPPLNWTNAPQGTEDYMVAMWKQSGYSWSVFNITSTVDQLLEGNSLYTTGGTVSFVYDEAELTRFSYDEPCSKGPGSKKYVFYIYAFSQRVIPVLEALGVPTDEYNPIVILEAMADSTLGVASVTTHFTRYTASHSSVPK